MITAPGLEGATLLRAQAGDEAIDGEKALREFDAYFLAQMLKSANQEGEEHLLDGGSAGRMYRDAFYDEIARVLAEHGAVGVSRQLEGLLDRANESAAGEAEREGPA